MADEHVTRNLHRSPAGYRREEVFHMSNYPGFDCYAYPGADVMAAWKAQSPYVFVGYYLTSDNHPDGSWLGNRPALQAAGWGLAVVYLALPATSPNLARQRGMTDAADALSQGAALHRSTTRLFAGTLRFLVHNECCRSGLRSITACT